MLQKPNSRRSILSLSLACAGALFPTIASAQVLWSNPPNSTYTTADSVVWTSPAKNVEAADDFDVQGTITRITVGGYACFGCWQPPVAGCTVRFYAWNAGNPGALLSEQSLPAGDPNFLYDPNETGPLDITLPTPFVSTGKGFVSVQVSMIGAAYWSIWISNKEAPTLGECRVRDNLAGGAWGPLTSVLGPIHSDLTFTLYGPNFPPPSSLDPCGKWQTLATPNPSGNTTCVLRAVKAIAPDDVWAVGTASTHPSYGSYEMVTVAMHWNGSDWTLVPTPNPAPGPGSWPTTLHAVDAVASNDVWAGGSQTKQIAGGWTGQQILVTRWNGSQWTVLDTPVPASSIGGGVSGASVHSIDAVSANDVWFAGDWIDYDPQTSLTKKTGLLMHWNGSSFTLTLPPLLSGMPNGQGFEALSAAGPNDVWAVGGAMGNDASPKPVVFRWDGSQWSHVSVPIAGVKFRFEDVDTFGSHVWIVGVSYATLTSPPTPVLLHYDGNSWATVSAPAGFSAVKAVEPGVVYAVGTAVYRYDGSWTEIEAFPWIDSPTMTDVQISDPCKLVVVGAQYQIGKVTSFAARINDGTFYSVRSRSPCWPNGAPGSLAALTPPKLGTYFTLAVDDPNNAAGFSASTVTYWLASSFPDVNFPCGTPIPLGGAGGAPGELLVDLGALEAVFGPQSWLSPGNPSIHVADLTSSPALVGRTFSTQGLMVSFNGPNTIGLLTNALDITIGW